jgi:hypothetical protein
MGCAIVKRIFFSLFGVFTRATIVGSAGVSSGTRNATRIVVAEVINVSHDLATAVSRNVATAPLSVHRDPIKTKSSAPEYIIDDRSGVRSAMQIRAP